MRRAADAFEHVASLSHLARVRRMDSYIIATGQAACRLNYGPNTTCVPADCEHSLLGQWVISAVSGQYY
jgi:hypothetical protein